MKKLIAVAAFMTLGLFAYTGGAAPSAELPPLPEPAAVAPALEASGSTAACPVYAPKCCAFVGGRCLQCVGRYDQCP